MRNGCARVRTGRTSSSNGASLCGLSFGLPQNAFSELMKGGPHLLAPTGSDLAKYCSAGTVFAGYHYDLNFLTIHGKSRFPGLFIWLRDGRRVAVAIPDGCLLLQARHTHCGPP